MKKVIALLIVLMLMTFCGCNSEKDITADCENGNFVGAYEEDTGVMSFKGIPYAKAPVGDLRWKAPESVEASDETFDAKEFGDSSIQYKWFSEPITTDVSEDCLSLNVWTKDLDTKDKPVMVFIHGGSFSWGGSSEEIYNGQYIVDEHEDVLVVTINYRVGIMGFIDFSDVEGGENFEDTKELGLLDAVEALKWIKKNISAFGGDPENVTIFGESAGGAIVSGLLASDYAGELFDRVIAESGSLYLTYDEEKYKDSDMTKALMKLSGAKNMDDLMALSTEELIELNEKPLDEDGNTINDLYNLPLRGGKVINEDSDEAIRKAAEKGVDLLIGTNKDEQNYWITEMGEAPLGELTDEEIEKNLYIFENYYIAPAYAGMVSHAKEMGKFSELEEYMKSTGKEELWARSAFLSETVYTQPAIKMAEEHSKSGEGKTYMYYFEKAAAVNELLGACHSIELPYVFHRIKEDTTYGAIDEKLADDVCEAWVNFAKTGDPSSDEHQWKEYDKSDRETMVIGNDNSFKMVSDPGKVAREKLNWTTKVQISANGT